MKQGLTQGEPDQAMATQPAQLTGRHSAVRVRPEAISSLGRTQLELHSPSHGSAYVVWMLPLHSLRCLRWPGLALPRS